MCVGVFDCPMLPGMEIPKVAILSSEKRVPGRELRLRDRSRSIGSPPRLSHTLVSRISGNFFPTLQSGVLYNIGTGMRAISAARLRALRLRGYRGVDAWAGGGRDLASGVAPADAVPRKRGGASSRTGHHRAARTCGRRGGALLPPRITSVATPCDRTPCNAAAAAACGASLSEWV